MVTSSSVCSVTYSAATPIVSTVPFAPPLDVIPAKPVHKRCHEDSSVDRLMLAAFEEVYATRKAFVSAPVGSSGPFISIFKCCFGRIIVFCPGAPVHLFLLLALGLQLLPCLHYLPSQPVLPGRSLLTHGLSFVRLPLGLHLSLPHPIRGFGPGPSTHLPLGSLWPL